MILIFLHFVWIQVWKIFQALATYDGDTDDSSSFPWDDASLNKGQFGAKIRGL